jgi:hypothetical protein
MSIYLGLPVIFYGKGSQFITWDALIKEISFRLFPSSIIPVLPNKYTVRGLIFFIVKGN